MTTIIGVILAGGIGSRLGGVHKANLKIGGVRLIDRAYRALATQCDMVLCVGRAYSVESDLPHGVISVPDAPGASAGPVSGLAGAVLWQHQNAFEADFMLTVAVDTPFLPADIAQKLQTGLSENVDVVCATDGTDIFPTNALWRLTALQDLPALVHEGKANRGLRAIHPKERTALVNFDGVSLRNINTLRDLLACQALCRQSDDLSQM